MNLTSYEADGYLAPAVPASLRALRDLGTTDVAVVVTWYVNGRTGSDVAPDPLKSPTPGAVLAALRQVQALGMRASVKPLVDATDGTFRGDLAPRDRPAWYRSYARLLDECAVLARAAGADTLVVGTELKALSGDTTAWRDLIARARRSFGGQLTYGANWVDEAEGIRFWDALDAVGVDAYMPLASVDDPTVAQLQEAWAPYRDRLAALHRAWRKPVLFTELGYPSRQGAARLPGREGTGAPDPRPQARAYEAALRAFRGIPWFRGIFWWDWPAGDAPSDPGSYTPRGKPAADLLRRVR
jgi:hypothetical protein